MNGYYVTILLGAKTTIAISVLALMFGVVLGMLGAAAELSKLPLKYVCYAWHIIIRGFPDIFIIFVCYFGVAALLSSLVGHYVNVSPFDSGVISLAIIFGAYSSQIFIASYNAIPVGEVQAAQALGLSPGVILKYIILPPMWQHAWPGLTNLWLVILKDSSILSLIGLNDIMNNAHVAASESFEPFTYYLFAALLYLLLTWMSVLIGQYFKHKAVGAVSC